MPLRILHLTAHSEPGGLSRYIHDLALAMHNQGHDVRVAGNRGAWHWLFERAPFPYIELPLDKGPLAMWRAARALRRHLRENPVDVIHSHYRRTTLVGRRLQRRHRPPLLYTIHLSDIPLSWGNRLFADYGDHVHVASAEARRWAIETARIDARKISLIPHGIHLEKFPMATASDKAAARAGFGLAPDDLVAVFVGRLDHPKNESWLLDVVQRSRDLLPNLKILIAGTGPRQGEFLSQRQAMGLESRVVPLGELENPLPAYQAADAMLLPSQREGFSLATAEAMAVGIPVCRTRTAGSGELIQENITGRTSDIDRESFVTTAIDFLKNRSALVQMGTNASAHVRANFSFERQLEQMTALYRRLSIPLEQKRASRFSR